MYRKRYSLFLCIFIIELNTFQCFDPFFNRNSKYEYNMGDLNIGYLISVHEKEDGIGNYCSNRIRVNSYFDTVAVRLAVKRINDNNFIKGIKLGYTILDDCDSNLAALGESLYFLPAEIFHVNAVIGPYSSTKSMMVSPLLSLYRIPQLSRMATSDELSDKSRFPYFSRIVSPDRYQANAVIEFISALNWNYFSLIYSEGSYGENGAKKLRKAAEAKGICLAIDEMVPGKQTFETWQSIMRKLTMTSTWNVIVILLSWNDVNIFYSKLPAFPGLDNKIFIGMDTLMSLNQDHRRTAAYRSFYTVFPLANIPNFVSVIISQNPDNSKDNVWIDELWSDLFNCKWNTSSVKELCQKSWNITASPKSFLEGLWSSGIYDATFVLAEAMRTARDVYCPSAKGRELKECVSGERLLNTLRKGNYSTLTGYLNFDRNGDVIGDYDIMQYGRDGKKIKVGKWLRSRNIMKLNHNIRWINNTIPESICSKPCPLKYYTLKTEISCCWECRKCRNNEIIINNSSCKPCPQFTWPDVETSLICSPIDPVFLEWHEPESIFLLIVSSSGLFLTFCICVIYRLKRDQKLIKASSILLSNISLIGSGTTFLTIYFIVAKPTNATCLIGYITFNLSYSIIYAPFLCKVIRLLRIFKAGSTGKRGLRFIQDKHQIIFSFIIILLQLTILSIMISFGSIKSTLNQPNPHEKRVQIICNLPAASIISPLVFNILISIICCFFAFQTRKLPENFNEASQIFGSVCTTLFVWIVLVPAYFIVEDNRFRMILLASCCLLNASVTTLCLFMPKLYALRFVEKCKLVFNFQITENIISPIT
ncbi:DgyrCDS3316 [Dimorphilus gyrociliatus]|uniref:DgyrCDS3316 n=1 Tax=Dimorphilus gyrociliatus TaxID=2664684 RepID=A0A7I8VDA5_9ANNE|nr:DgyrCDS3316 [Dimorphilus gyrociliatus]